MNPDTITQEFTFLGVTVAARVPATAEAWDAIQGKGSCVQEAVSNHGFRGFATPVRSAIIKALKAAGYEKNEGEGDAPFIKRLVDEGVDYVPIVQADADAVDFVQTMAGGTRAEVGKDFLEQAAGVVAKIESGTTTLDKFLTKMRTLVPSAQVGDPTDVTAIARVIRAFRKKQAEDDLS